MGPTISQDNISYPSITCFGSVRGAAIINVGRKIYISSDYKLNHSLVCQGFEIFPQLSKIIRLELDLIIENTLAMSFDG